MLQEMTMTQEYTPPVFVFYDNTRGAYCWDLLGKTEDGLWAGLKERYGRDRRSAVYLKLEPRTIDIKHVPENFIPDTASHAWETLSYWCTSHMEKLAREAKTV